MTLQVSFEEFVETVKRLLKHDEAYVAAHDAGTLITSAKPDKAIVVAAVTSLSMDATTESLKQNGFEVFKGTWLTPEEMLTPDLVPSQTFIAAVSYRSVGDKAGVWVDAYPALPTQVTVLKSMYEEFKSTGEMNDASFEEFIHLANPNVVILTPAQVESFVREKSDC